MGIVDAHGGEVAAENLQRALKRGSVKAFEALGDLAAAFSMPKASLETTVADYNQWVEEGRVNPFGKALFQGAKPLITPPFYAIRFWPKAHYTSGGVRINEAAQVMDLHGAPILRLFAAGEVCGGIHGASRLGSCSLTECIVFGRIAGKEAAR